MYDSVPCYVSGHYIWSEVASRRVGLQYDIIVHFSTNLEVVVQDTGFEMGIANPIYIIFILFSLGLRDIFYRNLSSHLVDSIC